MKKWTFTFFAAFWAILAIGQDIQAPRTQHALVTKLTATWCSICGGTSWDNYKTLAADLSTKALVMAGHASPVSSLHSPTAAVITQNFDFIASQPSFFYNSTRINLSGTTLVNTIITNVNSANAQAPDAQSGLMVRFDPATRELTVQARVEFFRSLDGEFFYGLYLLEKAVIASQAARSGAETHQNVLRTSLLEGAFGQPLSSGRTAEGTLKGFLATHTLPAALNPSNLILAGIIWRKNGEKYEVVNVNWTSEISSAVTSVQDAQLLQGFQIWPNLVREEARVLVQLPDAANQVSLEIFDMQGRLLGSLFQGRLGEGEHTFSLRRSALPASGQYLLRLRADGAQATRVFITQ